MRIESGMLRGEAAGDIAIFRGIPFAAPPTGARRWRPPGKAPSWPGIRDATKFGPACPQASTPDHVDILLYGGAPEPTSEDCLTLNVWAPMGLKKPAAVMVWIHGGAGIIGSGSLPYYDGASFARDGVVVVSFNYRLGHLGNFAHPALTKEARALGLPLGRFALMDQMAALEWVKRNIGAFGGDPHNVTVFGESAGGVSIFYLLTSPPARGLFEKAVIESGGGWFPPPASLAQAEKSGETVAREAGAPAGATLAQLRALDARAVAAVQEPMVSAPDSRFFEESPTVAIASGRALPVPLLIGVNDGEDTLVNGAKAMARAKAAVDPGTFAKLKELYGAGIDLEMAARLQFRDSVGTAPARWVAANWPAPAYLYRFEHVTESYRPGRKRAAHGGEIFYVFKTLGQEPDLKSHPTAKDIRLADEIHARWVAFAKTGVPNAAGHPAWPVYSRDADTWMVFGQDRTQPEAHVLKAQLDWYEGKTRPLIWLVQIEDAFLRFWRWI